MDVLYGEITMQFFAIVFIAALFCISNPVYAGTFWFPLEGYYPYQVPISAVPDLDTRDGYIKTRLSDTGKRENGCIDNNTTQSCVLPFDSTTDVWGFKKDGGGDWWLDGVPYDDGLSGSGSVYMWYDNHRGYDFAVPEGVGVHAVEAGTTCTFYAPLNQVCLKHVVNGVTYQTYYAHMRNVPTRLKTVGNVVTKWEYLGYVSKYGAEGVHLHFVTRKLVKGTLVTVDPYGHKEWRNGGWIDTEPYLWN
jgi:murein DD-endopeptidase MepM/ murein hydrolase activator NlpD